MPAEPSERLYSPVGTEAARAAKEGINLAHSRQRLLGRLAVLLGGLLVLPGVAHAAEQYTYTAGILGGIGGSFDADPGDDLSNSSYQLNLSMVTEPRTQVGLRIGKLDLDSQEAFGTLTGADLSYVTIAGEYRFQDSYYESGLYIGLGGYRLSGNRFNGKADSQTSVGVVVGVTGEITVNRWLGVVVELSGHYVDLDEANLYGMGHAGLAFHF
jgi:hypothetical protein